MAVKASCSDPETQRLSAVKMSLLFVQHTGSISASKIEEGTRCRSGYCCVGNMIPGTAFTHVDLRELAALRVSPQEGLWALWTWPRCFGGESDCSCEDTSCAVPVLHRTQELFSGCCIHSYNSAYRGNSEAEAHSYRIYLYHIAKSATHSGALGQQQERELALMQVVWCSSS